ncbi:MAG TPA: hypothetical protein VGC09_00490 [Rhodopila sp.]
MLIDRKLNLVVPIEREHGTIYVHSTPIGREVFDSYFIILGMAHSQIFKRGMDFVGGPRLAAKMIEHVARQERAWEGPTGVENGLMAEIKRLTNVLMPSPQGSGWTMLPLDVVATMDVLTEDEYAETLGVICFFTLVSAMTLKKQRPSFLSMMTGFCQVQTTSLDCSEFVNSLPTSTGTGSSAGTATVVVSSGTS